MNEDFSVIIPTYNERENIGTLISELLKINYIKKIIIVDDNSSDGTKEIIKSFEKFTNKIILIERKSKLGIGSAYLLGSKYVDTDFFITMDGDLSHNPIFIEVMKNFAKRAHIVIGSRHIKGSRIIGWGFYRYFVHNLANFIAKLFFLMNVKDLTTGFRVYNKRAFEILSKHIISKGFAFQVEILLIAKRLGFKIYECPIVFVNRKKGSSKFNMKEALEFLFVLFKHLNSKLFQPS